MTYIDDLKRHQADHDATVWQAAARVLDSGWFVLGHECSAFEVKFTTYLDKVGNDRADGLLSKPELTSHSFLRRAN